MSWCEVFAVVWKEEYPKIRVPLLYVYALLNKFYGLAGKVSPKKKFNL